MGRKPLGPWVVVGVDGSAEALAAADAAATEATLRGLRLRVMVSLPEPSTVEHGHAPGRAFAVSGTGAAAALTMVSGPAAAVPSGWAAQAEANAAVSQAARRVHAGWPPLTVSTRVASGDPADRLIEESLRAGLVVVGASGLDGARPAGSVCLRVAGYSHCPVLVVPSGARASVKAPVLVGVDAGAVNEAAVGFAFQAAAVRKVPLRAVYVWTGVPDSGRGCVDPFAYDIPQAWAAADRLLATALAGWERRYPQVVVERQPYYDVDAAQALLQASHQAGLVVVGHPRKQQSGLSLGPVARTLIQGADCPVALLQSAQ